mgnify:CR=1 FL=1
MWFVAEIQSNKAGKDYICRPLLSIYDKCFGTKKMCASAPRVKVPPVSGKSTRRPKANTMASKPVQIRRRMFGPNQYNTYCPVCFQKGIRSGVKKYEYFPFGKPLKNGTTRAIKCARKNKEGMPDTCGWGYDL